MIAIRRFPWRWPTRETVRATVTRAHYLRTHLRAALPYLTPAKVANIVLNELELRLVRTRPRSLPPYIKIEATPLCHLSCAGCAHRSKSYKQTLSSDMHLTAARVRRMIEPVAKYIVGVSLSYSGEPMLNRALPDIVRTVHEFGICTSFPTNLSVPLSDEQAEELVGSGIDLINVSLDGATAKTYALYRVGGNFDLVVSNVRKLAGAKVRLCRTRPLLIWKMVIFPHNRHEIAVARETAHTLGFDGCDFQLDNGSAEAANIRRAAKATLTTGHKPCFWPWNSLVLSWDGEAQPCCKQLNRLAMGNAGELGIEAVWRGDSYAELRRGFVRDNYGRHLNNVCRECLGL